MNIKLNISLLVLLASTLNAFAAKSVTFAWNPNIETNLAGYRLFWGFSPRTYESHIVVDHPRVSATISNLVEGYTYYVAVTAFLIDGQESDYSDEVRYTVPTPGVPQPPSAPFFTNQATIVLFLEQTDSIDLRGPWQLTTNVWTFVTPGDPAAFYRVRLGITK